MRAVIFDGKGGITLEERAIPALDADTVLIVPELVGICGTDLHLLDGEYPLGRFPRIGGHEFSGKVVATGAGVTRFAKGERVCVDPNIACGHCPMCRDDAPNLCLNLIPVGVTIDGAFAEYVAVPEKIVHALPESLDARSGALIEPMACVVHALERAPSLEARHVLVYGAGSIGLLAIALVRHRKAACIEVIEPSETRRRAAIEMGADSAYAPGTYERCEDVHVVIEASGHPSAVADALTRLAPRGTLVQMGVCAPEASIALRPYDLFKRELTLIGSQSLAGSYGRAIGIMAEMGDLGTRLVSHVVDLEDARTGFALARSEAARKVMIRCMQD
ncbi:alcohol dehydrogenase catalytic domain-containing protein [Asaia krungthepensis]|uniref:Zinc-containing alcohol dehydrogenase n=1 Tax=Asaia krungthepensis NRIC 0535 TaxID=1307925 RepID=A0ABQ0PZH9_9PROT|nr:alcohol dehydrogenase catalytic domain-containing protein [Asaia krungthepensis]GBQ85425.1 zinc-containing alcohol dehydrogenase [Asaia krungthepensis NRIC 0535]